MDLTFEGKRKTDLINRSLGNPILGLKQKMKREKRKTEIKPGGWAQEIRAAEGRLGRVLYSLGGQEVVHRILEDKMGLRRS